MDKEDKIHNLKLKRVELLIKFNKELEPLNKKLNTLLIDGYINHCCKDNTNFDYLKILSVANKGINDDILYFNCLIIKGLSIYVNIISQDEIDNGYYCALEQFNEKLRTLAQYKIKELENYLTL